MRPRALRFVVCNLLGAAGAGLGATPAALADPSDSATDGFHSSDGAASRANATSSMAAKAPARAAAPVDVAVTDPVAVRRIFAIEWNPVALFIDRISANVELVPADHHALVINGYYFNSRTAKFSDANSNTFYSQRFEGVGGEIGYRYYTGRGGPQGFFAGPSLLATAVRATAAGGVPVSFNDLGLALDVGWQALVVDRWVVSLGIGAEYFRTSRSIPDQQAPASYYAGSGLHPRALASVGCAF